MRIGIIGTGRMAVARAGKIAEIEGAELAWVCSRQQSSAADLIGNLDPAPRERPAAYDDWHAALGDPDTDGIIITTPNTVHRHTSRAALEAGKHVLVEYPDTTVVEHSRELLALANDRRLVYHVGLTGRFGGLPGVLKDIIHSGELGTPHACSVVVCSGNPISRWYDRDDLSGGMFIASCFHYVDDAIDLFGPVADVSAHYSARRDAEGVIDQDCGDLMLRFDSGCVAHVTFARGHPKPGLGTRRVIICERGYIEISAGVARKLTPDGEEQIDVPPVDGVLADTCDFVERVQAGQYDDPTGPAALETLGVVCRAAAAAGAADTTARETGD